MPLLLIQYILFGSECQMMLKPEFVPRALSKIVDATGSLHYYQDGVSYSFILMVVVVCLL